MRVHVGTSGYNYPEWKGTFYPDTIKPSAMFDYYAARFHTVEINYTFRRMPTVPLMTKWRAQAPEAFSYTLKAPQRITHFKQLKDCADDLRFFVECARALDSHLATLLFQLPPTLRRDDERLTAFLALLPKDVRCAFEFRNDSWLADEVYAALQAHNAALCVADFGDKTTPLHPTARYGYFRLRDEGYQTKDLERWVDQVSAQSAHWDDAFVYFKHEEEGKGPEFAKGFLDILARRGITTA